MKAIDFVVRDSAGGLQRGSVSNDAQAHVIQAGAGQEISLNLRQADLQSTQRAGEDLVITLTDGRQITIDGYFNSTGQANRLFISSEGYLNEVSFVETEGGNLYAQFGPTEQWGKWSPSDDLIYLGRTEVASAAAEEEVSMFAAPLLGAGLLGSGGAAAAALAGGAVLIGGVGGGTPGAAPPAEPFVNEPDAANTVGGDDAEQKLVITGGGEPEDKVTVKVGDKTVETVIDKDGTFEAVFEGENFPNDGLYEAVVTVVTENGPVDLDGPSYHIDTTPPQVEITTGVESTKDFFNGESFAKGVTLTGKGEPGATLAVTIEGITQNTVIAEDGTWSVGWAAGTLKDGEYSTGVTLVAKDAFGNSTTLSDVLVIDTQTHLTVETATVETDGVVNAVEREDGVTLTGTAEPGATVVVTFGTGTHTATVDATGKWSAVFLSSEIPTGESTATVSATATDIYGNATTATGQVDIDTLVRDFAFTGSTGGADGVINIQEAAQGLVMTGTTEPGSTVNVTLNGVTHAATVATDGSWSVNFSATEIPSGQVTAVMTAVATDAAGNVKTITRDVEIDRDAGVLTISAAPVEGDDVVNEAEASDGVVLTGTSNPGALVDVTMAGVTHQVTTDAAGNWTANFSATDVAPGVYTAKITATTTDAAGNTLNATDSVEVDTRVDNLSVAADTVEGDGVINGAERTEGGGVQVTGTTEVGSSAVVVTMNGVAVNAVVDAAGNWSANYTADQVSQGTYDAALTVTATDRAGNTATLTDSVRVDTEVDPLSMTNGGGGTDKVASASEVATGIDLAGQVEAGSTVTVNFDGTPHAASVDAAGNWRVTIPPNAIRAGTYSAAISVSATDAVGNVDTITDTLAIDTDAPDGPVIASYTRDGDGIRGISTEIESDALAVHQVHENGSVSEVSANAVDIPALNETNFQFNSDVPDGSHLVVTATDGAGNSSGTYLVLDDEVASSATSLSGAALGRYNIETVDLNFAEEGKLTIDEASLLALSGNTNELQILGGADDKVTATGAVRTGSEVRDGQSYDIYTLGNEGRLIIDDDITVVV